MVNQKKDPETKDEAKVISIRVNSPERMRIKRAADKKAGFMGMTLSDYILNLIVHDTGIASLTIEQLEQLEI